MSATGFISGAVLGACIAVAAFSFYSLGWMAARSHFSSRVFGPWLKSMRHDPHYFLRSADWEAAWENYKAIGHHARLPQWKDAGDHLRDPRLLMLHQQSEELRRAES